MELCGTNLLSWVGWQARSLSGETSVHLSVNATVAHEDLEGNIVTPGVVPGVDAEPVVLAVLGAPTDGLDGVATEGRAGLVRVNTRLVGQEVLVDGEGSSHGSVLHDISLDVVDSSQAVAGGTKVLVVAVGTGVVVDASLAALGSNLSDVIARLEGRALDVMGALLHRVVIASAGGAEVATSHDASALEPGPRGADLATVAAHRVALEEATAGGSVSH